ncbi:MAG TPA: hypothetical protein VF258_09880, partial [Luteolibacter sp.]
PGKRLRRPRHSLSLEGGTHRNLATRMTRKPLQGLVTVLRFNWHFFALALAGILFLPLVARWFAPTHFAIALVFAAAGSLVVVISLAATLHAYDFTGLYSFRWLDPWMSEAGEAANIHSGFDETSGLLGKRHPGVKWHVFDFYDPLKHTEISIKRARAVHHPHPGTRRITTSQIPLENGALSHIVLMLAAHEIRDHDERVTFFRELGRVLTDNGVVFVTEHMRDFPNIIAYTLGAWHFHPRSAWLTVFEEAGFMITGEMKNNLLITTFILRKHAMAS